MLACTMADEGKDQKTAGEHAVPADVSRTRLFDLSLAKNILKYLGKWIKTRKAWTGIGGTIILFLFLAGIFSYQAGAFPAKNPYNYVKPDGGIGALEGAENGSESITDYAAEGTPMEDTFELNGTKVYRLKVTLTWTDEPNAGPSGRRLVNQPDTFEVEVALPDGKTETKQGSGSNSAPGTITLSYDWVSTGGLPLGDTKLGTLNAVGVVVTCTNAGDQTPRFSPFGFRNRADGGNDYTLTVDYLYSPEKAK